MKIFCKATFLFIFLTVPVLYGESFAVDLKKNIGGITVDGVARADENTVRYYIHSKEGAAYSSATAADDIRRIYELGFFDDVKVDLTTREDGLLELTFLLQEKPFVKEIIISGLDDIEEPTIREKIKSQKGTFFRQDQTPWDKERIKQTLRGKGYYFTDVKAVVHRLEDNQVNVEYIVDEGSKITIGDIIFRGNVAFSDRGLLDQIETASGGWQSVFSDAGAYKKDVLKTDILRLESFYHDNGYLKVRIFDPEVEIDRERQRILIVIPLDEGAQYTVGKINVQEDEVYDRDELLQAVSLKEGDVFNRSKFRQNIFGITDMYSRKGYAFASVSPGLKTNDDDKIVDITVRADKGRKVYIGEIIITGNDTTRDRVIRREFRLDEGELFDSSKLRRSRERINNLGFFESVEVEQRSRREENLVDIEVKVIERSTGQISFAMGYSSVENFLIQGQVKWGNLLGRGQEFSVTLNHSSRRTDFTLSFTEPALFDRFLSAGMDIYNKSFDYDNYNSTNTGASFRIGRSIGEYTWLRLGYKYEQNEVTIDDNETASAFLLDQEGESVIGSIYPSLTFDNRNDPFNPSKGQKLYGYFEFAGVGGNENFYRAIGEHTYYSDLFLGLVGMIHSKIGMAEGYAGRDVPIYKRFFLGGPRSMRGFNFKDIGPKDENGDAIGGEALLQFNAEIQYRFTRFFRGFLFYDRGNVYGTNDELGNTKDYYYSLDDMRHSWGFGVHFFSPMGPISLAYGFKLDQRDDESPSEFHFTIGGAF